jgi:acetylornithine deacetylase
MQLLGRLVGAQAGGEAAVQAVLAEALCDAGCSVETFRYRPGEVAARGEFTGRDLRQDGGRSVILGRLPARGEGGRSLLLFAHPDSETPGEDPGWSGDPFAVALRGGRLHGWGVADDLAGCAAAVLAMARLGVSEGPRGEVVFAAAPSKRSARGTAGILQAGLRADAALYLHPAESGGGMAEVKAITCGHVEFAVTVTGRPPGTDEPCHTPLAHRGVNPVDKAVLVCAALRELDQRRAQRLRHPAVEAAAGRSTNLMISALAAGRNGDRAGAPSRLPEDCRIGCALSFPPGETLREVRAEVEAAISEAAATDEWLCEHPPVTEWLAGTDAAEVPRTHPFWEVASGAVTRVTGRAPVVYPLHSGSDIRVPMLEAGMPCLGLGCLCGDLTQNGRCDEWIDAADFALMVEVVAALAGDWCMMPRAPGATA